MFVTHLDVTSDMVLAKQGDIAVSDFERMAFEHGIDKLYLAGSRYSKDVRTI